MNHDWDGLALIWKEEQQQMTELTKSQHGLIDFAGCFLT